MKKSENFESNKNVLKEFFKKTVGRTRNPAYLFEKTIFRL
jgi:hypothetical protein